MIDPEGHGGAEAESGLAAAPPALSIAAGQEVEVAGSHDPFAAVPDAINLPGFDEVIISMLPAWVIWMAAPRPAGQDPCSGSR